MSQKLQNDNILNLYLNNVQYKDVDYKAVQKDVVDRWRLAEVIRDSWELHSAAPGDSLRSASLCNESKFGAEMLTFLLQSTFRSCS